MIIGECPYVDCVEPLWIPIADNTPAFERHECEGCERAIWTLHSRIDPWSMTEADFLTEYEVDQGTKSVSRIGAQA